MPPTRPYFLADEQPAAVPIWLEALAPMDRISLRLSAVFYGSGVPRGAGAPVVLVPGFLASDWYLVEMFHWLQRIGYRPYLSRIGRNADCLDVLVGRLLETIEAARAETGRPVHLIGHSLGGMLARAAALRRPESAASLITLGSPFRGIRPHPLILQATRLVRARTQRQRGRPDCFTTTCGCETVASMQTALLPATPQIAIYTRSDGIVDWQMCVNDDPETNFEVSGTHVGLAFNPAVYRLVARRLAEVESLSASAGAA
jgi:triacylglycerol lipase